MEDVDFRLQVTRNELEEMCADLYDRFKIPVDQALKAADMTMVSSKDLLLGHVMPIQPIHHFCLAEPPQELISYALLCSCIPVIVMC